MIARKTTTPAAAKPDQAEPLAAQEAQDLPHQQALKDPEPELAIDQEGPTAQAEQEPDLLTLDEVTSLVNEASQLADTLAKSAPILLGHPLYQRMQDRLERAATALTAWAPKHE